MKIECTVKRQLEGRNSNGQPVPIGPGSVIPMGDQVYTFKPEDATDKDGLTPHVCEVTNPDHIARFKEIPEGFKPGPGAKWPKVLPETSIGKVEEKPEAEVEDDGKFGEHVPEEK